MRSSWPVHATATDNCESRSLAIVPIWLAPVAGLSLGIAAAMGNEVSRLGWVFNAGGTWLLLAFAIGWFYRDPVRGVVGALVTMLTAVATYYLVLLFVFDPRTAPSALIRAGLAWAVIALIAGPAGGLGGALARVGSHWPRVISVGFLSGVIAGESFWQASQMWRLSDQVTYGSMILVALAFPWAVLRRPVEASTACGVAVIVGGIVSLTVPHTFDIARSLGI